MLTNLVNLLTKSVNPTTSFQPVLAPSFGTNATSTKNPFITGDDAFSKLNYGKNNPMPGGYFAGYYNGKPNIVGSRLFVEV